MLRPTGIHRSGEAMEWNVIPAEYDMPAQRDARYVGLSLIAFAAIAIVVGAGLALVHARETGSPVAVPTSK